MKYHWMTRCAVRMAPALLVMAVVPIGAGALAGTDSPASAMVVAAAAAAPAQPAAAAAQRSLTGVWVGSYRYTDSRDPVQFLLVINQGANGSFTGSLREPNTFGDSNAPFLGASISGSVKNSQVKFSKVYDGTGGQSHGVVYEGVVNWKTRVVSGQWTLAGATGAFRMTDSK